MAILPLDISIWTGDFNYLGACNDPQSMQIIPAHLAVGTAKITVDLYHRKIPLLGGQGNRLLIKYLGQPIMSGPIRSAEGAGGPSGTMAFTIEDDVRLLWRILGWPVPGSPLASQGTTNDVRSGPAETVLKGYLQANSTRLGLPVEYATDLGRGSTISGAIRMTSLSDALLPQLANSGIGLKVIQDGDHLLVDVYETTAYPHVLTERSGIVQDWSWSTQAPTVTRTVVGGEGVGTAREFNLQTDATAEAAWFDVIESFTDDRDEPDVTKLPAAGQATLTDGAATAGLSVTLSETATFRYGDAVNVGDTVPIEVGPGISITDVLTQATLNWDRETGFTAGPTVGDHSDDPTKKLVRRLVKLNRTVRKFLAST